MQKNYADLTTDIVMREYETVFLAKNLLAPHLAETIWSKYSSYLNVDFPSIKNEERWKITARGWVGYLAVSDRSIIIEPKVDIEQFFEMVECAFDIRLRVFDHLVECNSVKAFYNFLAQMLIVKIRKIKHLGLARSIKEKEEWLPHVRGKILLNEDWKKKHCSRVRFYDSTVDNFDNQVLIATLRVILCNANCFAQVQQQAREMYYWLCKHVKNVSIATEKILSHLQLDYHYNRLNAHYEPIHALCRFFLSHTAPYKGKGTSSITSFLVNMPYLYEKFVANWLRRNLQCGLRLATKEKILLGEQCFLFVIDMVLYKKNMPFCVIDTKYKNVKKPPHSDIFQLISYAKLCKCSQAVLVYPCILENPIDQQIGNIRIRSISFVLDKKLDISGKSFLQALVGS
ncbi:McrC family protein [Candidatus Uabimicrobium sp. HlEnr_7]|uniref:McrC family protein n=1 Tax=Candidatus Uabimicrobium helgolandensis TaxID=3095367 RepID=UPI003556B8D6